MELYERLHKAIKEHSELTDEDIWELAADTADEMGLESVPMLVATFNCIKGTGCTEPHEFENALAWFALEEIGHWLESKQEEMVS